MDVPEGGVGSLVFDRIATPCHPSGYSLYSVAKQSGGGLVDLAGQADANSLEPKSTDLGSRSFAPLHARDIIDRPGRIRVVSRVCSCLARRLRAL